MAKDLTKHNFVPKHIKASDKESEELLKKYNIVKRQLPRILITDPALKDMKDLKRGDIIKILRKSPTCGESTYYRVVSNG